MKIFSLILAACFAMTIMSSCGKKAEAVAIQETTAPTAPAAPKAPTAPEAPAAPKAPAIPEAPIAPETPVAPEAQETPEIPSITDLSKTLTIGYAGTMMDGKTKLYMAMDDNVENMAVVFLDEDNSKNVSLFGKVTENAERACMVVTDESQQISLDFAPIFNPNHTVTMDFGTLGSATIEPMDIEAVLETISTVRETTKSVEA